MHAVPVLLLTHDDALWDHWRTLPADSWLPARGRSFDDLTRWQSRGHRLVLLDMGLPRLPAWGDAAWGSLPGDLQIVATSMRPGDTEGKSVLAAGASGYVHAYSPAQALDTVLKTVKAGGVWMGPTLLARLLRELERRLGTGSTTDWAAALTTREREVAERAAIGHSNQAIADALSITERTVRAHLSAVFEKLGVTDRLMLALRVHGIQ